MKILLVNALYYPNIVGGAERSVQVLAETLVQLGHRVSVLTSAIEKTWTAKTVNDVSVYYVKQQNIYSWPPGSKNALAKAIWHTLDSFNPFTPSIVNEIIEREKPNLVHTNNLGGFSVSVWHAASRRKLPIVHTLRDYYLLCPRGTMFKKGRNCIGQCTLCTATSWPKRRATTLVRAVVGVSASILDSHTSRRFFPDSKIKSVIHNAFVKSNVSTMHTLDVAREPVVLGFLGQMTPEKGVELLLDAGRQLPCERFQILLAGRGEPNYEQYLKETYLADNIHFLGFVPSDELLRKIHVLVIPSLWQEPFPRVAFEAFSHGVPIIGTRRGGIPEVVDVGKTGFLFDPENSNELINTILNLSPAVCQGMERHCIKKAEEFTPEHIASQYLQIYENAMRANEKP